MDRTINVTLPVDTKGIDTMHLTTIFRRQQAQLCCRGWGTLKLNHQSCNAADNAAHKTDEKIPCMFDNVFRHQINS